MMLKRFWNYVSCLGIEPNTPDYLRDKIMLANRLIFSLYFFVVVNFVRLIVYAPWIFWIALFQFIVYTSVLVANRYGKVLFSRLLMVFAVPVMVVVIGSIISAGVNYSIRVPLLATIFAPLLLIDFYRERKWMIAGIAWNFLAQVTFHWFNEWIPNIDDFPGDINSISNQIIFSLMCSFVLIFGVIYFIRQNHEARERIRILAEDLQNSNHVLALQAQTIAETNEELKATLQQISDQNTVIAKKNTDIIESIEYAKRIQTTILPDEDLLKNYLPNAFFYYRPKDIVSGDFYWFVHLDGFSYLASIDCTGHGVPGAFMSVMAYNQLNQIVLEKDIHQPKDILSNLDRAVRAALKQDDTGSQSRDGMDITLVRLDHRKAQMTIASAQRPYLICREGVMTAFKGDRFPIGFSVHDDKLFTEQHFELHSGDRLYLFSDGITDQFGGEKGRKVTMKRFENLLISIQDQDMEQQKASLDHFLESWKGKQEQLDDIMVIGVQWAERIPV